MKAPHQQASEASSDSTRQQADNSFHPWASQVQACVFPITVVKLARCFQLRTVTEQHKRHTCRLRERFEGQLGEAAHSGLDPGIDGLPVLSVDVRPRRAALAAQLL